MAYIDIDDLKKHKDFIGILNKAIELSLEWGKYWQKPINERIIKIYHEITDDQAERLDQYCKHIQSMAFDIFEEEYSGKLEMKEAIEIFSGNYPELSKENVERLRKQATFFARK